jgi:hypothetical protein
MPGRLNGPGSEVAVKGITKVLVSLFGLAFGVALLFAPSAHAQAESNPDHFTATGYELGPGGSSTQSAEHASAPKQAKNVKPVAQPAAQASSSAAPVHVAMAVADKNRPAIAPNPKQ